MTVEKVEMSDSSSGTPKRSIRLTITAKLVLGFGLLLLLVLAIGIVSYFNLLAIGRQTDQLVDFMNRSDAFHRVATAFFTAFEGEADYIGMQHDEALDEMAEGQADWEAALQHLDSMALDEGEKAIKQRLRVLLDELAVAFAQARELVQDGEIERAKVHHREVVEPIATQITDIFELELGTDIAHNRQTVSSTVDREIRTSLLLVSGLGIGALIVGLVAAILISRSISVPIKTLTDVAREVREGHLDVKADVSSWDETEVLADVFNQMVANLRRMLLDLQEAANNLSSAASEILAATAQQSAGASEQSAAISQTTTTVDEVRTISEQAIVRSREVADSAQRTVEVSRAGRSEVTATIENMDQIKERVSSIAENIMGLSEQTQQIGEIIATVNEIASQSNMLALNASVEAARAGEHGKGFAVVAVEVRNLAERSKRATAQVRSILTNIQNAINASVMVTEEGTRAVDEGVARVMKVRESIEQLSSVITESAQVASQVVVGGQQQSSGVEQIAMAMENIQRAMQQNLSGTHQTEQSAQNLNELASALSETVRQYRVNGHSA